MANLVRLRGDTAELPYLSLRYSVAPAESSLREGLAAYQDLKQQVGLQSLPAQRREEITAFLRRLGGLLHRVLFPEGQGWRLHPGQPILLETDARWAAFPWELLNDGRQWMALQQGLVRFHSGAGRVEPGGSATNLLAVTAQPLPGSPEDALGQAYRDSGARFVSSAAELPEPGAPDAEFAWRILEHADVDQFERALRNDPHILLWSGFATPQSWLLEGKHLEPDPLPLARLTELLRDPVRRGLRLVIANDSLGLLDPAAAAEQASTLLAAGLPALIRIEGGQARPRQQDYLRTLARHLGQGFSEFESHLAAIRRLYRRFASGWDWSYPRLHTGQIPPAGDFGQEFLGDRGAGAPGKHPRPVLRLVQGVPGGENEDDAARPAPPVFRRRRRVFARHAELRALAQAVLPEQTPNSPLVFLNGPAGCGKSVLALEIAQRMQRRFDAVVHLEFRDLLPEPDRLEPDNGIAWAPQSPAERLSAALAPRLGVVPAPGESAGADIAGEVLRALGDGARRLVILDGLEGRPGFDDWLAALAKAPPATARILVTVRGKPPVLPGFRVELRAVDGEALAMICGDALLERIRARPDSALLLGECRRDLLAARVLRRLARWPDPPKLAGLLRAGQTGQITSRDALLTWAGEESLRELGEPGRRALEALCLLTGLVHQEVIAQIAGLDGRDLAQALAELQWFGLADAHDGERYLSLHPRLLRILGERLISRPVFARLAPRLTLAYEAYLAGVGRALAKAHSRSAWHGPEAALAWLGPQRPRRNSADPREVQRLGAERANLAEAALMLLEESDVRGLSRLVEEARALSALAWQSGLLALLGAYLHAGGRALQDEVMQARALNRIGAALLSAGDARRAARALERALDLISRHASWDTLSETYLLLARAYARLDHLDAAENLLISAVELAYQLGAGGHLVPALAALCELWRRRGRDGEQAEQFLPRAIGFLEERHQMHLAAQVRRMLGDCRHRAGAAGPAEADYRQALGAFQRAGDRQEASLTGLRLAESLIEQERTDPALEAFEEASHALHEAHAADPEELARILERIARQFERQRRVPDALRAWLQIRDWREQIGDRDGVIAVLDILGGLYFQLGEREQSTRCYEERLMLQAEMPAPAGR